MGRVFVLFFLFLIFFSESSFANRKRNKTPLSDSSLVVISKIVIVGNKKTKEKVISRELMFAIGDTIYSELLGHEMDKSRENLLNTSLFNYVTINSASQENGEVEIYIILEERWYLWPYLIFEQADRNLSEFLHNKDWSRINYGMMLVKNNFRGMGETVKLKLRMGYKPQFQIAYEIPYIGKSRKHGLAAEVSIHRQHEIPYITKYDKQEFYKDEDKFSIYKSSFSVRYQFRNKYYLRHSFILGYSYAAVSDTIVSLNNNYFGNSSSRTQFFTAQYVVSVDKRNYKYYPLNGYNYQLSLQQQGFSILEGEIPGVTSITGEGYFYKKFGERWYTGGGGNFKLSSNYKQPYYIEQGLGFGTYLRGFEYYVVDGQSFVTGRTFLKFAIVPLQVYHIESWGWSRFNKIHYSLFVNLFYDAGYVYDINPYPANRLSNRYLGSVGIGVDLVAYYDQVIRFEYSYSRSGEPGFYLHVKKAF